MGKPFDEGKFPKYARPSPIVPWSWLVTTLDPSDMAPQFNSTNLDDLEFGPRMLAGRRQDKSGILRSFQVSRPAQLILHPWTIHWGSYEVA